MGKLNSSLDSIVNSVCLKDCMEFMRRLPGNSIDFCMTSPPYWRLRDYGIERQIGMEDTPEDYVSRLVVIFREMKRVLKDTGSFYLNLGDTYIGWDNCHPKSWKIPKQLALIPSRVAIALQEDGWILRNDICWFKPNGPPSSVRDRLSNRWEHLFHFVKKRKYYYRLDEIRESHKENTVKRVQNRQKLFEKTGRTVTGRSKYFCNAKNKTLGISGFLTGKSVHHFLHPNGKNPGDVWEISVKPFQGNHFAAYPADLCVRPIKSSCPPGGIVFDMFAGSGTTLVVAKKLGRRFLGCELNPAYVKLVRERLRSIKPGT